MSDNDTNGCEVSSLRASVFLIYDHDGKALHGTARRSAALSALEGFGSTSNLFNDGSWFPSEKREQVKGSSDVHDFVLSHKNEPEFEVRLETTRLETGSKHYVVQLQWVGEQRRDQEKLRLQLLKMARLACIGSLGGPIAHALNNPLATIRGFAEVLKRRFAQLEKVAYFSEKIVTNSDRMRITIDQLRKLSRPGVGDTEEEVNLNGAVESTLKIMEEQFKMRNIDIDVVLAENLPSLPGDHAMWESAFMSLMALSRDSFQVLNDGRKKKVMIETFESGGAVGFRYSDTAGGFPPLGSELNMVDPLSHLTTEKDHVALPVFVVLEVLRIHDAQLSVNVEDDESAELSVVLPGDSLLDEEVQTEESRAVS